MLIDMDRLKSPVPVFRVIAVSNLIFCFRILTTQIASKKEAQFYFSEHSIKTIVENFSKNNFTRVLCIGTPKIHEKIRESYADKIDSLLMDFDGRLSQFFGKNEFCYYNMFNHFFFGAKSNKQVKLPTLVVDTTNNNG